MKKLISSLFLCFALLEVHGQVNLVPNPSFEERTGCPQGYPDLDGVCSDWMSFRGSPDYFNNCSSMNGYNNNWGYQEPHSGDGYISLIPYSVSGAVPSLMREHLGTQLTSPLIVGVKYYVNFYISAAWEPNGMNIATNKTGILFTTSSYSDYWSEQPLNNRCHVWTEDVIADTVNWIKVAGSFIADSAYTHLVIGNLFEDSFTDTINLPNQIGFNQRAMQYIDDICVSTDSLYAENWTTLSVSNLSLDAISLYPNPVNDILHIESEKPIEKVAVYNSFGQLIFTKENFPNDDYKLNLEQIDAGIYFVKIRTQSSEVVQKIAVN